MKQRHVSPSSRVVAIQVCSLFIMALYRSRCIIGSTVMMSNDAKFMLRPFTIAFPVVT